jgi:large subunit ribosomal protein L6
MMLMADAAKSIEIPSGTSVKLEGNELKIQGKRGSTAKRVDQRLLAVGVEGTKVSIALTKNEKLQKKAELASMALTTEVTEALKSVNDGIERKMTIIFAHFPMSTEIKGKDFFIKNIFGEKIPRKARIVGDTKVEVKGQDVKITGVDKYDVGQTVTNILHACHARGQDTRVFQDGIYPSREE